ncbi:DHA2 family efflux MFS transporter permease subunit [Streptomonospora nanhaiensis]|uniref:DHA2 family efflux MFS transporter permease subunit n=1 Tax=Streptomonospora nanhaiensis TaxID=1323731 RepID=UPI001C3847F5|nr:DHA2 family efflux MFS transporter permease subunit [Streptomonospora nanhaiensis]MBV2365196.1 DHA2 family efflux MFS transporter permease subunit [Streptomonospora nanhaiensis]MBX9387407.1 DHA2 family efflux MFS transporter permease subunit [Streptomonospora nanhaiensis]
MASRSPRARPERPAAVPIPARIWWMAAVTGSGAFMAMLDSTVANLALEPVRSEFGTTLALVQWVATGYLVAGAVSLPAAAWLGDRFGHGRVWAVSLAAFTAASAVCALAPGPMVLIAARAAQGLAAGAMVPAGQAVIASEAGAERMGRLMGALGVVVSLGPAVGPAVGGLLVEAVSWRWVFAINVPVGIAALLAARALVPAGRADRSRRLDLRGLLLLGTGLPLLLFGATEVGAGGAAPLPLLAAATGAVLVAVFAVAAVRAASSPLLDLRLLGRPAFAAATATAALTGAAMYGGLLLLAVYLPEAGRGGTEAGMLLLAMGLGSAAALYAGGALTDRRGPRAVSVVGAVLLAAATAAVLLPGPEGALSTAALAVVLVVRGAGMALAQMPAVTAAYGAVPPGRVGDAATLVNISQRVGGALGAAGVVLAVVAGGGGPRGYVVGFTALTAVALLAGLTATALRRGGAGPSERD